MDERRRRAPRWLFHNHERRPAGIWWFLSKPVFKTYYFLRPLPDTVSALPEPSVCEKGEPLKCFQKRLTNEGVKAWRPIWVHISKMRIFSYQLKLVYE